MSEAENRVAGAIDETVGKIKRGVGEALDRPDIKAEGDAQEAKGDLETAAGKAQGAAKRVVDGV